MINLLDRIKETDIAITKLEKTHRGLLDRMVLEQCPYKVGDIIKCTGFHHYGKPTRITYITIRKKWSGAYEWKISGCVFWKEGSLGLNRVNFSRNIEQKPCEF